MKTQTGKTSRRNFAKSIAATLVAAPLASTIAQQSKKQDVKVLRTHDTPPPLTFENGSFVLEREDEFQNNDIVLNQATNRLEHKMRPVGMSTTANPNHIKIVAGNGDILYRNDEAGECLIITELANGAVINARASVDRTRFIIDTEANKQLVKGNQGQNDKPTSKKRNRRYRHPDLNSDISKVTVKKGNDVIYSLPLTEAPADGADLRIMIWLE